MLTYGEVQRASQKPLVLSEWEENLDFDERLVVPPPVRSYRARSGELSHLIKPYSRDVIICNQTVVSLSWSPSNNRKTSGVLIHYEEGYIHLAESLSALLAIRLSCTVLLVSQQLHDIEVQIRNLASSNVEIELADERICGVVEYTSFDGFIYCTETEWETERTVEGIRAIRCQDILAINPSPQR